MNKTNNNIVVYENNTNTTKKPKKLTNADRIKNMNNEELANFMDDIFNNLFDTNIGTLDFPCEFCTEKCNCDKCFKEWLDSEAK